MEKLEGRQRKPSSRNGQKSIQFKVVLSVNNKIENLEQIRKDIAQAETIEEKQILVDAMQSIIRNLTAEDLYQIENDEEYKRVIESCEREYEIFNSQKNAMFNDLENEEKMAMWVEFIIIAAVVVSVIVVIILVYERRNKYKKMY